MKKSLILLALLSTFANVSFAEDTATINSTANVNGSCKFSTTQYIVDFGSLKHSQNFDVSLLSKDFDLMFECTNGTQASVDSAVFPSGPILRGLNGAIIPYFVSNRVGYEGSYVGNGYGQAEKLIHGVNIRLSEMHFKNAPAGDYQGLFIVSVNY